MKITTKVRYAARLMLHLALNYNKSQTLLKEISQKEGISEKYLGQIVIPLKAAGLLTSKRGAYGGYALSKLPVSISIKDIVEVFEGSLNLVKKSSYSSHLSNAFLCINTFVWEKLEKNMLDLLGSITLKDLVTAYAESNKNGIMYSI